MMKILTLLPIANILKPTRIGLVYCYGVQSVAETLKKPKIWRYWASGIVTVFLIGNLQQIEFRLLTRQEAD